MASNPLFRGVFGRGRTSGVRARESACGRACSIEQLEQRVLLSASDGLDAAFEPGHVGDVSWRGVEVEALMGQWVVGFGDAIGTARAEHLTRDLASRLGVAATNIRSFSDGRIAVFNTETMLNESAVKNVVARMADVKFVDPDIVAHTAATPNDPSFGLEYYLDNTGQFIFQPGVIDADIDAPEAWDITTGNRDVIIAVIDTGVEWHHPDLAANIWANPGEIPNNGLDDDGNGFVDDVRGWDFGENDNNPDDDSFGGGHGTAVSGTLGAVGNNGIGVVGVNWNVSILPLKIADRFGSLLTSAIIASNDYLTSLIERGVNVVASNNSFGGAVPTDFFEQENQDDPESITAMRNSIARFLATGAAYVAAAGNDARDNDNPEIVDFPSSFELPGLISVAATDNQDGLAGFSNYGAQTVDVAAPGVRTYTTFRGGSYGYIDGTSFSSPITAGVIGLMKAAKPEASAIEIRQALVDSVDPLPGLSGKVLSGGRVNAFRAVQTILRDGPVVRAIDPGPVAAQINPLTGLPRDTITVSFNRDINEDTLSTAGVTLIRAGNDGVFGTGDDAAVTVSAVDLSDFDPRSVTITLDVSMLSRQRLPLGVYRLTLDDAAFKDLSGNFLNGDASTGQDEVYEFTLVSTSGDFEANDTLATATNLTFVGSGTASFAGVTLGNGLHGVLDVDLYKISIPRGALITAEVTAKRLTTPSELDSYLRLFDAAGQELTANDQFFGFDSYIQYFIRTGGTFYLGVSGFGNDDYNINTGGSGRSQSTGVYNLDVRVELIAEDRLTFGGALPTPVRVPAQGTVGQVVSAINVTDSRIVRDVNVRVDLDHTFVSDLRLTLVAPNGTAVQLFNRRGGSADNLTNTFFDDEASATIASGAAPFTGLFKPEVPLGFFDGLSGLGQWLLVIDDLSALNDGQLNSWSLDITFESDIFGDFELNDSLQIATTLTNLNQGVGSATIEASVGDGAFGLLDRDLFRFNAEGGGTLNATLTATGALDAGLRLFDAEGNELRRSNPPGTGNASITNFVIASGGTYYLAVSEGSNLDYDVLRVNTGSTPGGTSGEYQLALTVVAGVSDAGVALSGDAIEAGLNSDGSFTGRDPQTGLPRGIQWEGTEFLFDESNGNARPVSLYGASAGGFAFVNSGAGGATSLPVNLTYQSDRDNERLLASAQFRELSIERTVTFGSRDGFIVFDVVITNTGIAGLDDVSWFEAFNPDQGANAGGSGGATSNDVLTDPIAIANVVTSDFPQGLAVALAAPASDTSASALFYSKNQTVRDAAQVLALAPDGDPNDQSSDSVMALAFDLGTIAVGETRTLRYFVLFGEGESEVQALYDQINNGTGTGHLTANPANPASEALSDGSMVPVLPYRLYYPEGFASANIYEFLPIVNPNLRDARVVVIAHYAAGDDADRDQVLRDFVIPAGERSGLTINTPALFAANNSLVRPNEAYALEIRADLPVAAMFSHYDLFLLNGNQAAIGESFINGDGQEWSIGEVVKGSGRSDFPVVFNAGADEGKVTFTFYPTTGAAPIAVVRAVEGFRRGGLNLDNVAIPDGRYGLVITSDVPIVAALSSFDTGEVSGLPAAYGYAASRGLGATRGASPEGEFGVGATDERIAVLNANNAAAFVDVTFVFQSGSSYRTTLNVPARRQTELDVASLLNFPSGQPYAIKYESNVPITLSLPTPVLGDVAGSSFATEAATFWAIGEGYRPATASYVTEYLRLYNPSASSILVEITLVFDNGLGRETFRREIDARGIREFDVHDFVTGERRDVPAFYGITVKSATPIVAYFGHNDQFFKGGFGTLGTPFGVIEPLV
ncbi:MAG: S8 family serine peptidase [Phycisphaerales bacterium]|nr:S8 family serine peptidase [Phycisphaerales bacterium]